MFSVIFLPGRALEVDSEAPEGVQGAFRGIKPPIPRFD